VAESSSRCCRGAELKSFLAEYSEYPALGVNWIMFGADGRRTRPPKPGMLRWYSQCNPVPHPHVKVIANTRWLEHIGTKHPHNFHYKYGFFASAQLQVFGQYSSVFFIIALFFDELLYVLE
jgi:hypothetical protein